MSCAGPKYEYLWADGENVKRPIKVSAPDYVDYLMTWVQTILDDETVFPSRVGRYLPSLPLPLSLYSLSSLPPLPPFTSPFPLPSPLHPPSRHAYTYRLLPDVPFPKTFINVVKQIFKRLFRVSLNYHPSLPSLTFPIPIPIPIPIPSTIHTQ